MNGVWRGVVAVEDDAGNRRRIVVVVMVRSHRQRRGSQGGIFIRDKQTRYVQIGKEPALSSLVLRSAGVTGVSISNAASCMSGAPRAVEPYPHNRGHMTLCRKDPLAGHASLDKQRFIGTKQPLHGSASGRGWRRTRETHDNRLHCHRGA